MATLFLGLDKRRIVKYPKCPLSIRITHKRQQVYIGLGLRLTTDQWDEEKEQITGYPNFKRHNNEVQRKWLTAQAYLLKADPVLESLSPGEVKELFEAEINRELIEQQNQLAEQLHIQPTKQKPIRGGAMLGEYAQKWINLKRQHQKRKTAMWYKDGITQFLFYLRGSESDIPKRKWGEGENYTLDLTTDILITEITPALLDEFMLHLKDVLKHKQNGIGARLRAISAIIGKAMKERDEKLLPKDFRTPFDFISIPSEKTAKRGLAKENIKDMRVQEYEIDTPIWHNWNYFLFMFNLKGMNWIDVAKLRCKQINNGRLQYVRSKNGRYYDIQLTPEATKILSYYLSNKDPDDYVFPILPNDLKNDGNEISRIAEQTRGTHNDYLKIIQEDCGIQLKLTSYVSRHTWAGVAKKMGESIEKISEGLGHEKITTTQIYLDSFESDEMDDMNMRITA